MRKFSLAALFVAFLAAISASAQTQPQPAGGVPDGKVAVINTSIFPEQILELRQKYEQVNNQYKDRFEKLRALDQQLKQMETDLQTKGPAMAPDLYRAEQQKYEDMKKRGQRDLEDLRNESDRTLETATKPVRDKLYQFLQTYAQQRGIVTIINLPGVAQTGSLAYWNPGTDITQDFIKEYNKANPVPGAAAPAAPAAQQPKPNGGRP